MTAFIEPDRLAYVVRRRIAASTRHLNAYWMTLTEDRDGYAEALTRALDDEPVVVVVLRDDRFSNPNALLSDFVDLVGRERDACETRLSRLRDKCGFVLLSRTELAMAQISSPVLLPTWFPIFGGTIVWMLIEDLTWTADAPLAAAELDVGGLCETLLELDDVLVSRIRRVKDVDHRKGAPLLEMIRRSDSESLDEVLQAAADYRLSVQTPSAFRPSLRDGRPIVARLWSVAQKRTAEQLKPPSKALATSIDVSGELEGRWYESVCAVLGRPSTQDDDVRIRFARNLLISVSATCQLLTASAHADAYGLYPMPLLRSLSYDLRRSLSTAETLIRTLDD